jgi:hypothetical protein
MLGQILLIFAFVIACLASFLGAPAGPWYGRANFLALALAFYFASLLFGTLGHLIR